MKMTIENGVCERPIRSILDRYNDIKVLSLDISSAAVRLHDALYGCTAVADNSKSAVPACFEEDLDQYEKGLDETREIMYTILSKFGVQ